ncbi:MAG: DMT family transporter [Alphaproteobacteria bacterium]
MTDGTESKHWRLLAYAMLTLVALFWALNTNIARATADEVPPLALTFWRLFLSTLILAPFALHGCWKARRVIRNHFWFLNLLAALSMTLFNGFVYIGVNHTVAVNANILQGAVPIGVLVASTLFVGRRITWQQWTGVALGFLGLLTIVFRGDPAKVLDLAINIGDPLVFLGVCASSTYAAILHKRPKDLPLVPFMFLMMLFSAIHSAPFFAWEHLTQRTLPMTWPAIGTVLYVTIFASVLAQLFFAEGIRRIGAPTAGNFIYLTPVFGVAIAVLLLGETFHLFHAAGVALIATGIWLALYSRAAR